MPGEKRAFDCTSILVRPRGTPRPGGFAPPGPGENWWRRRVLPPGPQQLLRTPFIAIVASRRQDRYRTCRRRMKEGRRRVPGRALPSGSGPRGGCANDAGDGAGRRALGSAASPEQTGPPPDMPTDAERPPPSGAHLTEEQQSEIEAARAGTSPTGRATVPAMEDILYTAFPVLDRGFVRVVDYMGDDAAIVQAARVSYGRGTRSLRGDAGLIRYLMRHRHTTPFRNVRDQAACEAADLRRAPVDSPPYGQCERIFGAVFRARPRILHSGAGASGGAVLRQPAGPERCAGRRGSGAGAAAAARGCCGLLCPLRGDAERGAGTARRPIRAGGAWRGNWRA